eukprot:403350507
MRLQQLKRVGQLLLKPRFNQQSTILYPNAQSQHIFYQRCQFSSKNEKDQNQKSQSSSSSSGQKLSANISQQQPKFSDIEESSLDNQSLQFRRLQELQDLQQQTQDSNQNEGQNKSSKFDEEQSSEGRQDLNFKQQQTSKISQHVDESKINIGKGIKRDDHMHGKDMVRMSEDKDTKGMQKHINKEQFKPEIIHEAKSERELTRDILCSEDRQFKDDVDRMAYMGNAQDQGGVKMKQAQRSIDEENKLNQEKWDECQNEQYTEELSEKKNIGKTHQSVEPDKTFDKYQLNKGAVDHEGRHHIEKTTDPTFNNPKLAFSGSYRIGYEHISGHAFDPLVQGDPGQRFDVKEQANERIDSDLVDQKEQGNEATKPITQKIKHGLFDSNPRTS